MRTVTSKRGQQVPAGDAHRDRGSGGIEMVAALGVVGVMASIITVLLTGMTSEAADTSCLADARALATAAVTYMTTAEVDAIAPTLADGPAHDRYEMTLVSNGYLRQPSQLHDLTPTGAIIPSEDSSC